MSDKGENDTALNFPELADDIRKIVREGFSQHGDATYVTKEEMSALRERRDSEQSKLTLSIAKMNQRIDDLSAQLKTFTTHVDKSLADIKVQVTEIQESAKNERQEAKRSVAELASKYQEDKTRTATEMEVLRGSVENVDDRITEVQKLANAAVTTAHQTQISLLDIKTLTLAKIDPVYSYLFGDDTRKPLMNNIMEENNALKMQMSSNHNQLQMLIQANSANIQELRDSVAPTIESVQRLNNQLAWLQSLLTSNSGRSLLFAMLVMFISGTPLGDFVISIARMAMGFK